MVQACMQMSNVVWREIRGIANFNEMVWTVWEKKRASQEWVEIRGTYAEATLSVCWK